jgi:hypothetical protein
MSNFFSEISSIEGKIKYQQYKISLIGEELSVVVPFTNRQSFFEEISATKPSSKSGVINILSRHNGRLED